MNAATREILSQNDSPTDWEYPPGFDWKSSMAAVRELKPHAKQVLGQPMKLDDQVQDASFFAELFVFEDGAVSSNLVTALIYKIGIRFSMFGKMVTVHTNSPDSDLRNYPVQHLATLLEQRGFQYVDAVALTEPYDGKLKGMDANAT